MIPPENNRKSSTFSVVTDFRSEINNKDLTDFKAFLKMAWFLFVNTQ